MYINLKTILKMNTNKSTPYTHTKSPTYRWYGTSMSKIELQYYSVDNFQKICIHCGVEGTSRTLGNSVEHYPTCIECKDKPDINRLK